MGVIRIDMSGSFGSRSATFSAQEEGHASAVGKALAYLADTELPLAIAQDHGLARDGHEPSNGFAGIGKRKG